MVHGTRILSAMSKDISYRAILTLAFPLILSMSSFVMMQLLDAVFLSWVSPTALAALSPAGMASFLLQSSFIGAAGYTSAFIAQYKGKGLIREIHISLWQGIYFAVAAGFLILIVTFVVGPYFYLLKHDTEMTLMETEYFLITGCGAIFSLIDSAIFGYFSGLRQTKTILGVYFLGFFLNAFLAYALIPKMGIQGAALATISSQAFMTVIMFVAYFWPQEVKEFWKQKCYRWDPKMFFRFLKFGLPNGYRFSVEMLAWTLFLLFIGRIGVPELAATNIAWRLNGIAFFPVIGLAQAVGILAGQFKGANQPDLVKTVTHRGCLVTEIWMVICSLLFVLCPGFLFDIFSQPGQIAFQEIRAMGTVLLKYVAIYCLLDGLNIVYLSSLQSTGDTRWTFLMTLGFQGIFLSALLYADQCHRDLFFEWKIATVFVMLQALMWLWRFLSDRWVSLTLVEPAG